LRILDKKAVSTLTLIILMLCAAVFGAFMSYMLVIANFYLEPENTAELVITEVNFPVDHADYFDVTVMNPSHSPSGTNITKIYFTAEGEEDIYYVRIADLELPIFLERGTSKTIRCFENWGQFAGKTITVHVSATNASGAVRSIETEFVKLEIETYFNATESCKYFNVTVKNNAQSAINLTLTKVYFSDAPVENVAIELPKNLPRGEPIEFRCFVGWEGYPKPRIRVETTEGYEVEIEEEVSSLVGLWVTNVVFNETNPSEISISFFNPPDSATLVDITDIVLTYDNGTEYYINGSLANPSLPHPLERNETITFNCVWPWRSYRDRDVTMTAYTRQGFTSTSKTVKTRQPVIFKITELNFNLTNTGYFLVNVTNMPCSLQSINVTKIKLNENVTEITPSFGEILAGEERQISCAFNWTDFRGDNVTVTVCTENGLNISKSVMLPSIELKLSEDPTFAKATVGIPYVNITVSNTMFSAENATITQIIFETENATDIIDGTLTSPKLIPDGYVLIIDANATIVCPWDWTLHLKQDLRITVQTAEGFSLSQTFQIPQSTP